MLATLCYSVLHVVNNANTIYVWHLLSDVSRSCALCKAHIAAVCQICLHPTGCSGAGNMFVHPQ
jgi:hypothetical protein